MRDAAILSVAQIESLDLGALLRFWQSDVGRKILAAPRDQIQHELPFTTRFELRELETLAAEAIAGRANASNDFVVVQGQVDVAVLLPEEIWILDVKTDAVDEQNWQARAAEYEPQLRLYALALERIYRRPVRARWLYLFSVGRLVAF